MKVGWRTSPHRWILAAQLCQHRKSIIKSARHAHLVKHVLRHWALNTIVPLLVCQPEKMFSDRVLKLKGFSIPAHVCGAVKQCFHSHREGPGFSLRIAGVEIGFSPDAGLPCKHWFYFFPCLLFPSSAAAAFFSLLCLNQSLVPAVSWLINPFNHSCCICAHIFSFKPRNFTGIVLKATFFWTSLVSDLGVALNK